MTGWRLLLTRPAADSAALAEALAAAGAFGYGLPLLAIEALPETPEQRQLLQQLERYSALVVVSKPAARLGLERLRHHWPEPPARLRWFCVGAGTAALLDDYLHAHGQQAIYPAAGDDSEALLALPEWAAALQGEQPRALIWRADQGRELIADDLRRRGVDVDYLPLYRRCLPDYPSGSLLRTLREQALNGVLVSSAQGLQHLCRLAGDDWPTVAGLPLLVPSPRVAALARAAGATRVIDCRGASTAALLAALRTHPQPADTA